MHKPIPVGRNVTLEQRNCSNGSLGIHVRSEIKLDRSSEPYTQPGVAYCHEIPLELYISCARCFESASEMDCWLCYGGVRHPLSSECVILLIAYTRSHDALVRVPISLFVPGSYGLDLQKFCCLQTPTNNVSASIDDN